MERLIQRSSNAFAAPLDDTLLIMSVERGQYFGLTGAGPRIWDLLENPTTEAAIVARLLDEYDVPADECTREVATFVSGLRDRGLLNDLP